MSVSRYSAVCGLLDEPHDPPAPVANDDAEPARVVHRDRPRDEVGVGHGAAGGREERVGPARQDLAVERVADAGDRVGRPERLALDGERRPEPVGLARRRQPLADVGGGVGAGHEHDLVDRPPERARERVENPDDGRAPDEREQRLRRRVAEGTEPGAPPPHWDNQPHASAAP